MLELGLSTGSWAATRGASGPAEVTPPTITTVGTLGDRAGGSGALLVAWPAVANGRIAWLHVNTQSAGGTVHTITTPTGFTAVNEAGVTGLNYLRHGLYWKRCDGTESGNVSITTSIGNLGAGDIMAGVITITSGALSVGTPYEALVANTPGAADANMASSALTTLGANRLVLHFGYTSTPVTATASAGYNEEYDLTTTSGADGGLKLYTKSQAAAGVVAAATHTLSAGSRWSVFALGEKPA